MDVINELSKYMIKKYAEKWYNFLFLIRINKKIKQICKQLKNEDIFKLSDCMVSFLNAIPNYILEASTVCLSESNLSMEIDKSRVNYNATLREVSIYDKEDNIYYSIQKRCRLPSFLVEKWHNIDNGIRSFYIEIIADISYELLCDQNIIH